MYNFFPGFFLLLLWEWKPLPPSNPRGRKSHFLSSLCSMWRRKWQPTPVLLPGESHGQRSLVGYSPWGCKESDTTERARKVTSLSNPSSKTEWAPGFSNNKPTSWRCWWPFVLLPPCLHPRFFGRVSEVSRASPQFPWEPRRVRRMGRARPSPHTCRGGWTGPPRGALTAHPQQGAPGHKAGRCLFKKIPLNFQQSNKVILPSFK